MNSIIQYSKIILETSSVYELNYSISCVDVHLYKCLLEIVATYLMFWVSVLKGDIKAETQLAATFFMVVFQNVFF